MIQNRHEARIEVRSFENATSSIRHETPVTFRPSPREQGLDDTKTVGFRRAEGCFEATWRESFGVSPVSVSSRVGGDARAKSPAGSLSAVISTKRMSVTPNKEGSGNAASSEVLLSNSRRLGQTGEEGYVRPRIPPNSCAASQGGGHAPAPSVRIRGTL